MPYNVNFTDKIKKLPITVFDNIENTDTSLTFPGKKQAGYGQLVAENFVKLLENFANSVEPIHPIEGQLWYDNVNGYLKLRQGNVWKAASGIHTSSTPPTTASSGELWVDTSNQQLNIYTGTHWILIGPDIRATDDGLTYGVQVQDTLDVNNVKQWIVTVSIASIPIIIISKTLFKPKPTIVGYSQIEPGINVYTPVSDSDKARFSNMLPRLIGTASAANSLNVNGVQVDSSKFLRSDVISKTDYEIQVLNNNGISLGITGDFKISKATDAVTLYNSAANSGIDLSTNINGIETTVLRVVGQRVGINTISPTSTLDVLGDLTVSSPTTTGAVQSKLVIKSTDPESFKTLGGILVSNSSSFLGSVSISGLTEVQSTIQPNITNSIQLGTADKYWTYVNTDTIRANKLTGLTANTPLIITGNITGNADTATALKTTARFKISGAVLTSSTISFTGASGGVTEFVTELSSSLLTDQSQVTDSQGSDLLLIYRSDVGIRSVTRNNLIADLGMPIGCILPFAGATVPSGYLLCDGGEIYKDKYPELYDAIGDLYDIKDEAGNIIKLGTGTFRLPDFRGRMAAGIDNMDNLDSIVTSTGYGNIIQGSANRIPAASGLGKTGGKGETTLTSANLPSHTHSMSANFSYYSANTGTGTTSVVGGSTTGSTITSTTGPNTTTTASAFSVINPFIAVNYIIRAGLKTY